MYPWWYTDWFNGASYSRQFPPADGRHGAAGEDAARTRDERLARAVADAVLAAPGVTGGRIELGVQNGVVILDGDVDTEATRREVVALAWSVPEVADVCNALTVHRGLAR
ncbi:BON domain-containing protein [Couchioplanes caeruleus]|uniref:BON domain-containing protein n=1 Tax=Couchioplanes caeruleus TaxID=56438 RepID=UPI0020C0EE11|nr:BON domain-containing protein [Couchioplanes caeruleus]UQU61298.1 BON domain-containing protein [Couchioplanes caeruleus]